MVLDMSRPLTIAGIVIGALVVLTVLAAVAAPFFGSVAGVNEVLTNETTTTGDETADQLLGIFPLLVGVIAVFAIIGLIIMALQFRNGR